MIVSAIRVVPGLVDVGLIRVAGALGGIGGPGNPYLTFTVRRIKKGVSMTLAIELQGLATIPLSWAGGVVSGWHPWGTRDQRGVILLYPLGVQR